MNKAFAQTTIRERKKMFCCYEFMSDFQNHIIEASNWGVKSDKDTMFVNVWNGMFRREDSWTSSRSARYCMYCGYKFTEEFVNKLSMEYDGKPASLLARAQAKATR